VWSRGLAHVAILTGVLVLAACGGAKPQASSGSAGAPSAPRGPQLPPAVSDWLRVHYAAGSAIGPTTSADWVRTTHGRAATLTSGAAPDDTQPVYLFDVHGRFVWNHSCPPGAEPAACTSVGTDAVFTLDPQHLQVLDFGVVPRAPDLTRFGTVGHVAF